MMRVLRVYSHQLLWMESCRSWSETKAFESEQSPKWLSELFFNFLDESRHVVFLKVLTCLNINAAIL